MEDRHIIADIIVDAMTADPKINGITYERLFKDAAETAGMASYRVQRAIEFMVARGVLQTPPFSTGVTVTNKFIYGYQYGFKRLWYDEFEGIPLREKLLKVKDLRDKFDKGEITEMDYYYVLGRLDQTSFAAGYV